MHICKKSSFVTALSGRSPETHSKFKLYIDRNRIVALIDEMSSVANYDNLVTIVDVSLAFSCSKISFEVVFETILFFNLEWDFFTVGYY